MILGQRSCVAGVSRDLGEELSGFHRWAIFHDTPVTRAELRDGAPHVPYRWTLALPNSRRSGDRWSGDGVGSGVGGCMPLPGGS